MGILKNLKIGQKIAIAFGLTIALLILAVFLSLNQAETIRKDYQYTIDNTMEFLTELEESEKEVNYVALRLRQMALFGNVQKIYDSVQEPLETLNETLAMMERIYPFDDADLDNYINTIKAWQAVADPIFDAAFDDDLDKVAEIILNECTPLIVEVIEQGGALLTKMEAYAEETVAELSATSSQNLITVVVISGIAIIISIAIAISITKGITKPMVQVEASVIAFSEGNLSYPLDYQSEDELGKMAVAVVESQEFVGLVLSDIVRVTDNILNGNLNFSIDREYPGEFAPIKSNLNKLIDYMNDIISEIRSMSVQVSHGSQQVANAAQLLAQGSVEQTSGVFELSKNIKNISDQINSNSVDAERAGHMAQGTTEAIVASNDKMLRMMESMTEIDEKSKEISKIIKTIDDIAFQTNILALNAAVEAARAGSAGKGFAVVADEVRNLAAKSAEASRSTGDLIASSISSIDRGVSLAQDATGDTASVLERAKETSILMSKIVDASSTQASAINLVTSALDQISAVVQTNSATSEESAAASEELSSQSMNMENIIERFTLKD